jgi:SAM-dependent methyltransferase
MVRFQRMHPVDVAVGRIARWLAQSDTSFPALKILESSRKTACERALASHANDARRLAPLLDAGQPAARKELARIAERALGEMRRDARAIAAGQGVSRRLLANVHAWWADTRAEEYLDDPDFDPELRVRVLSHLDAMNDVLGSYQLFFDAVRPLLRPRGRTSILDLAAGHAGFSLEAARIAQREGLELRLVASDVKSEYLEIGAAAARAEDLEVSFLLQDALDLSNLERGAYDVITCTQSLHHFPAGLVAVMLSEALRVAGRGVVFVDGCPSLIGAAAIGSLCLFRYGDRAFAHDAVVSFRRFFAPEELELMTRLTARGERAEVKVLAPAYTLVRAVTT